MNQLSTFQFDLHTVRVVPRNGEPWWVAADVAAALGIAKVRNTIADWGPEDRGAYTMGTPGGPQSVIVLSESGLYRLIFQSRRPEAERFRRWVTRDVLPAIRKTGQYGNFAIPRNYAEALQVAADQAKRADNAEAERDELVYERQRWLDAEGCSSMKAAAAMLGTGRNRFFRKLRAMGIIEPMPSTMPYQKYIDAGYFVVRSKVQECTDGFSKAFDAAAVTPRGLAWLGGLEVDWTDTIPRISERPRSGGSSPR